MLELNFQRLNQQVQEKEQELSNYKQEQILLQSQQSQNYIVDYLLSRGSKMESSGDLKLAKKYYQVVQSETSSGSDEVNKKAKELLTSLKKRTEVVKKNKLEELAKKLETDMQELQAKLASSHDAELDKMRLELEAERAKLDKRKEIMEEQEQKIQEFETKYKDWNARIQSQNSDIKEQNQLLTSVCEAESVVEANRLDYNEKSAKAEDAQEKLSLSTQALQATEARLNSYLHLIESLVGSQYFYHLLEATQDLSRRAATQKITCFISYAWQPNQQENAVLQARLTKMKEDLERVGMKVMLDILNMEGSIYQYMLDGIQNSAHVILICTPRLKQRAEEVSATPNNLQIEYRAALQRHSQNTNFIIPVIMEGDFKTSVTEEIAKILCADFTDPKKYYSNMVNLEPKGLIPKILKLEDDKVYAYMLKGYHSQASSYSPDSIK